MAKEKLYVLIIWQMRRRKCGVIKIEAAAAVGGSQYQKLRKRNPIKRFGIELKIVVV